MKVNVKIKRLRADAVIPKYAHEYDAGFDLVAAEDIVIEPGETVLVPTGLSISLPPGFEAQIRPRSGISVKTKLRVVLGTIDSGYNGEVKVIVDNIADTIDGIDLREGRTFPSSAGQAKTLSGEFVPVDGMYKAFPYIIRKGDRIAQAVINQVEQAHFQIVEKLDTTERGAGGFGSSGVKAVQEITEAIQRSYE